MSENNNQISVATRLFALAGAAVIIAFSAIIAAVPINVPSRQSDYVEPSNSGDNAWIIVATTFVIALAPALTYLYGTLHGSDIGELVKNVTVVGSLITFLWILFS